MAMITLPRFFSKKTYNSNKTVLPRFCKTKNFLFNQQMKFVILGNNKMK